MFKLDQLSFVIPAYNEEGNIADLHREIVSMCSSNHYEFEIIVVNDHSTDRTLEVLKSLEPIKIISLQRKYGQTSAMDAGIKLAKFPLVVTMDGDGQNDPADVPDMIGHMSAHQLDVVSGWRVSRKDSMSKKFLSRGANILRKVIINDKIHDSGCSLKLYKREALRSVNLYGEMHRFIPALLALQGFSVGELPVNHRPRKHGISKYNWHRAVKGFIDMLAIWFSKKYAFRPLHLLGGLGLLLILLSIIFFGMTVKEFFTGQDMSDTLWLLLALFTMVTGFMFFLFGLVLDLIMKTYFETTAQTPYNIEEIYERE